MKSCKIKRLLLLLLITALVQCGRSKTALTPDGVVGGGCEGCELYSEGMPSELSWSTVMVNEDEPGERIKIAGILYKKDERTPAANVIMYLYQTDATGHYSPAPGQQDGARHGHLRGWIRTGEDGKYEFTTIRPAPYPNASIPAHIHPTIKEPGINEYYIDDYEFDDDVLLTQQERAKREKRGGSGIISLVVDANGLPVGHRDIFLGKNVPNYP